MCDHDNREQAMTVIRRDDSGTPTIWCDPCLAPLIESLNDAGLATIASCCGHGEYNGWVMFRDGRTVEVHATHDEYLALRNPELLVRASEAGASRQGSDSKGEISDDLIGRAAEGFYDWQTGTTGQFATSIYRDNWVRGTRRVLAAASAHSVTNKGREDCPNNRGTS